MAIPFKIVIFKVPNVERVILKIEEDQRTNINLVRGPVGDGLRGLLRERNSSEEIEGLVSAFAALQLDSN